jgi:pimeloyl-ACP methyl ester carboxylesterase
MVESVPSARLVEIRGASHDVHLEQPEQWRHALELFLNETVGPCAGRLREGGGGLG